MSNYPDLITVWYEMEYYEEPLRYEQLTSKLIAIRKNVRESIKDGHTIYICDERVIELNQWETYQDTLKNVEDINIANDALIETYDNVESQSNELSDINDALIELYEMIISK